MRQRTYPLRSREPKKAPDFGRVVGVLSDEELRGELERARGLPEESHGAFRAALLAELERRDLDPRGGRR